jgi:phage-related baseplate assembly protein
VLLANCGQYERKIGRDVSLLNLFSLTQDKIIADAHTHNFVKELKSSMEELDSCKKELERLRAQVLKAEEQLCSTFDNQLRKEIYKGLLSREEICKSLLCQRKLSL